MKTIHRLHNSITNKTILKNVERKSVFVDKVTFYEDSPLFSWLDINPTELCNRTCVFCPRNDPSKYPNQNLQMSLNLGNKIAEELEMLSYKGAVTFSGYGEPLLHPKISELIACFTKRGIRTEIVTNGDPLTTKLINKISSNGPVYFVVSMYDGKHQEQKFNELFEASNVTSDNYILRDRWYDESNQFGLKLTNRAGVYKSENPASNNAVKQPCFYPSYSMTIDWNGDVLLCVQDWNKRVKFGNLMSDSLMYVWNQSHLKKFRNANAKGNRKFSPCDVCNADGCVHGENHADAFGLLKGKVKG